MRDKALRPAPGRGLSARLLLLAGLFVLISEILIYLPSIARARVTFLEERIAAAHLATLVPLGRPGMPGQRLDNGLEQELLRHVGVRAITLWRPDAHIMMGHLAAVDAVYDLRDAGPARLIRDSLVTLWERGRREIRVVGSAPMAPLTTVDIVLAEGPLHAALVEQSWRILALSFVLSSAVTLLLFASLRLMIVKPLERIASQLAIFRMRPADVRADPPPARRGDEIGALERELALMRRQIRDALSQQMRLAALGEAVTKISHDLRNLLATAILLSDRLDASADPAVRKVTPRLVAAMERAVRLCNATLDFARSRPAAPRLATVELAPLLEEVLAGLERAAPEVRLELDLPSGLAVRADRDQLFRALLNVVRNAVEAVAVPGGRVGIEARQEGGTVRIDVLDDGPGIPEAIRPRLFQAFAAVGKADGTGLGLTIARELMSAQGGEVELLRTGTDGTVFRFLLPAAPGRASNRRSREVADMHATSLILVLGAGLLAACAQIAEGPAVAGVPGLQFQIRSYYDRWAWEENATCPQPRMQAITRTEVLEETPQRLVLNVRYRYVDEGQRDNNFYDDDGFGFGFGTSRCADFAERVFVIGRTTGGEGYVQSMTGPQRPQPQQPATAK